MVTESEHFPLQQHEVHVTPNAAVHGPGQCETCCGCTDTLLFPGSSHNPGCVLPTQALATSHSPLPPTFTLATRSSPCWRGSPRWCPLTATAVYTSSNLRIVDLLLLAAAEQMRDSCEGLTELRPGVSSPV